MFINTPEIVTSIVAIKYFKRLSMPFASHENMINADEKILNVNLKKPDHS